MVDYFKNLNPEFADSIVYVPMAESVPAALSSSSASSPCWQGISLKPTWKLLSWKTTYALDLIKKDMEKSIREGTADDGIFVPGLDDDDVMTAAYFEGMAHEVAKGMVQRRLDKSSRHVVSCHRPTMQLTIDPRRPAGQRLVFLQAPSSGMFSRYGAGACFHYPLSAITDVEWALPEATTAEDICGLRLFHYLNNLHPLEGVMAKEVKFEHPAYLERVGVGNW